MDGMWIIVEISERSDYDCEESLVTSKERGRTWGPFATSEEAHEARKYMEDNWATYEYNCRRYRCDCDLDVVKLNTCTKNTDGTWTWDETWY